MKTVTTTSGFTCEINEACLDDMELFDAICACDSGQTAKFPIVADKILGANKKALYDFHRLPDGRVPTTPIMNDVKEILEGLGKK